MPWNVEIQLSHSFDVSYGLLPGQGKIIIEFATEEAAAAASQEISITVRQSHPVIQGEVVKDDAPPVRSLD
jgi:hypothetical protein